MNGVISQLWTYLTGGHFFSFYTYAMNTYFPYGMFFWMLGLTIFGVMQIKTKNLGFAGAMTSIYFIVLAQIPNIVTNIYSRTAMNYFGMILGLIAGYYIYKAVKG